MTKQAGRGNKVAKGELQQGDYTLNNGGNVNTSKKQIFKHYTA